MENVGLAPALEFLLQHTTQNYKFSAAEDLQENLNFSRVVQMQIYRIAQEVLNNVERHSDAKSVEMKIETSKENEFILSISDDGAPFVPAEDAAQKKGRGIANIKYCLVFQIFRIKNSVRKTLAETPARLTAQTRVPFEKKILAPRLSRNIQILQSANATRDFVKFRRSYFAATGGGLAEFSADGKLIKHFTVLDGLPESDLTALAVYNDKLFVGTRAKNLVAFDGEKFENYVWTDRAAHTVTAFLETNGKLLVGTLKGGLIEFDGENFAEIRADGKRISAVNYLHKDGAKLVVGTFDDGLWIYEADVWTHLTMNEKFWLVSNQGISEINGRQIKPFDNTESDSLIDNFVSALAFDARQNLWIGTFRNGIDVFSAAGKKLKHLESEMVREINFLHADDETVSAATASGLQTFKADFSAENLTKNDGLPSSSITHFSGAFLATAKGLAFADENGKFRVLSTVQNLPDNSVYATLETGKKLYAGTLGGLAEIENNRVVRIFKDSNSRLTTNWVTALIRAGERIFVGRDSLL